MYDLMPLALLFHVIFPQHLDTGLSIAAWHGFPKIVQSLCMAGANLNLKNEVSIHLIRLLTACTS